MARNGSRDRKKALVCRRNACYIFERRCPPGDRRNRDRNGKYARQQSEGFSISLCYLTMKCMHIELECACKTWAWSDRSYNVRPVLLTHICKCTNKYIWWNSIRVFNIKTYVILVYIWQILWNIKINRASDKLYSYNYTIISYNLRILVI